MNFSCFFYFRWLASLIGLVLVAVSLFVVSISFPIQFKASKLPRHATVAFSSLSLFLHYFQMICTFWFLNGVLSIGFSNWVKTNVRRISLKSGYGRHNLASFLPIVWSLHPKNSCREKILQNKHHKTFTSTCKLGRGFLEKFFVQFVVGVITL